MQKLFESLKLLRRDGLTFLLLTTKSFRRLGVHVLPVHFYSPVPDLQTLEKRPYIWERQSALAGIQMNGEGQRNLTQQVISKYRAECNFPKYPTERPDEYYSNNVYFDFASAVAMHSMVRHCRPKKVIEVGAGFSTRVIVNAARLNSQAGSPAKIIAIDPYPEQPRFSGLPGGVHFIPKKIQDVDLSILTSLQAGDILSIDTSHTVRIDGDVVFLYLEVLPRLAAGVFIHIHDIFFPYDYPKHFIQRRNFWNEQYLLQAFLIGNTNFEIVWGQKYVETIFPELYLQTFGERIYEAENGGSYSFWMKRSSNSMTQITQ